MPPIKLRRSSSAAPSSTSLEQPRRPPLPQRGQLAAVQLGGRTSDYKHDELHRDPPPPYSGSDRYPDEPERNREKETERCNLHREERCGERGERSRERTNQHCTGERRRERMTERCTGERRRRGWLRCDAAGGRRGWLRCDAAGSGAQGPWSEWS
ncbi:hypothetical protein SESBI_17343 [Sesbania bispinosa]|nr:hypothetical protein SESBI_17343 [Sesbania bispinosa]